MFNGTNATTVLMVLFIAALCILIQKFFKKYLESDQYYYLKDITLVAAWALFGIWAPDGPLRVTIAAGVVAACIGFCQKVTRGKNLRFIYFLVGVGFALFGPRIAFVEFSRNEYYYLSYFASIAISTLWIGFFPIFFQEIDEVPGICGLFVTVSWTLISAVILSSSQNMHDASQLCLTGIIFLLVLLSRHIHAYRRLTEPLTALWGTLFAGVSILAVSKGVPFYTLALFSLGFFALPLTEILLSVISATFSPKPTGNLIVYRKLVTRGMDHASAVHTVVLICTFAGCLSVSFNLGIFGGLSLIAAAVGIFALTGIFFKLKFTSAANETLIRRPGLWGIRVDNISLNYAISQVQHWIASGNAPHIIVTPDALAALRSRSDKRYRNIVRNASLVLPDGTGLIAALRIIGSPVQERIPGVEFMEHLCMRASYEGWGIWLLGGKPQIAEKAKKELTAKYPGLIVCGTCDGFFKAEETGKICAQIAASGAKILFVGLGVPKQEYWLEENLRATGAIVGMGIGGSMDVLSGELVRAPKIWQKLGLEWLYRTIQEPWRWRRIAKLPIFVFYVILTALHLDAYKDDTDLQDLT
jgi:N-acetylglucosaminyldiphosphoundecaprenol N-acetyl-beta-D-mannosaminyltransferase